MNSVTVKAGVRVGQGDQHEPSARPDVQRVRIDGVAAVCGGRDRQFLVAVTEELFADCDAGLLTSAATNDRAGTVGSDQRVRRYRRFGLAARARPG